MLRTEKSIEIFVGGDLTDLLNIGYTEMPYVCAVICEHTFAGPGNSEF